MSTPLVTYFDDAYFPAFRVMLNSFLINNPWFDSEILVYDWGISKENTDWCREKYSKVEFLTVGEDYRFLDNLRDKCWYYKNFRKFELFKLKYESVVVIDADMVVVGDIRGMFGRRREDFFCDVNVGEDCPEFDTGIMIIGGDYLNNRYFNRLCSRISDEIHKDVSKDATCCTNEYIVSSVFIGKVQPIEDMYKASDITKIKSRIIGNPDYKYFLPDDRYKSFASRGLLPWDVDEEKTKSGMLLKYIIDKGYIC